MTLSILALGEKLPAPVRGVAANAMIEVNRYRQENQFKYHWKGNQFRFGYWDRVTFRKARDMIEGDYIGHEKVPIRHFNLDEDRFDAAIDIGAYFGGYSVVLAELNRSLPVHAFEPESYNLKVLDQNLALNGFGHKRVQAHQQVVSGTDGEVTIYEDSEQGSVSNTIHPTDGHTRHEPTTVDSVTASTFCEERGYENPFLKIDAEGAELDIFDDVLESFREPAGFIELHLNRDGITRSKLEEKVAAVDYALTEVKGTYSDSNPAFLFYPRDYPLRSVSE